MTKKIILSTITAATLITTSANALTLEERIAKLEKIIATQQTTIQKLTKSTNPELAEDVEDIDERLETIETRSYIDKISFGLGMRVEMNNYSNTYANGTSYDAKDIWRTKLNINMKSKIANNLKFSGRLSMYKNWGDSTTRMVNNDSMQGRRPDSSAIYAERAYLDWTMNPSSDIPVIMTLGRQASSDGPSYQFKEDTTRKGTYDALAFDGAADGIVFTANLDKVSKGTAVRLAYGTPNVLDNMGKTSNRNNYAGYDDSSFENTKVTGFFLDQTFSSLPFENLSQIYTVSAKDLNGDPGLSDANSTGSAINNDKNVGDLTITGVMFEASKINGNIDLFAHYAKSKAKPNGKTITMPANLGGTMGLLTIKTGDTTTKTGHAIWLGARYTINNTWKIGAEYNKGSQNWFSFTSGSNDPLNKLATRGKAVEVYTSYAVNKNANIRVGLVNINYDYTNSGSHLGAPTAMSDLTSTQKAGIIEKTKNAYLTFNVLF